MPNNIFDQIKKINKYDQEFWSARDLMTPLGYVRWENFEVAISRAKESCLNSKQSPDDHFRDVTKMVLVGSEAKRELKDYHFSRYACYLIAQNGDPRKEEIALAQTYFAIQTRKNNSQLIVFQNKKIRRYWDKQKEKWVFSVVDVIGVLSQSNNARNYWKVLKNRLKKEGSESVTKCNQLKMIASDGKYYLTDVADTETILRLVQSIPSPNAEPFKLWLAKVGYERMQETVDPERSLNRARENWQKLGRSKKWIQQRMMGQETRNKLTDYWKDHDVNKQNEYAILTNIIHEEWSDLSVKQHKQLKGLQTENLRDHMTEAELIFTALAELSTRQIAENMQTEGFKENKIPAKKGGRIAKNARMELEQKSGKRIVSGENFIGEKEKPKKIKG